MPSKPYLLRLGAAIIFSVLVSQQASADSTERVSVEGGGEQADDVSYTSAISADGRFVAFVSYATNLVGGDTNLATDIFVHDRQTGVTERVSVDSAGSEATGYSDSPSISADGRFVAFESEATDLVADDTNEATDIFVHDRQTGVTERVSVDSAGTEATGTSLLASISADGRYVAFLSSATDLVPVDANGSNDIFVHDRQTGVTERVSISSTAAQGNNDSEDPAISADGRFVSFRSSATNLVPDDTNGTSDVFVHDRQSGMTERVSVDSAGTQADKTSYESAMSADGRFVAFGSRASNLVADDTNNRRDIFVHDRQTGTTERVSVDNTGAGGNAHSREPSISADGRFVTFHSDASNLVVGDTNSSSDIFVYDRRTGRTERASVNFADNEGLSDSESPSISADGRFVAFLSDSGNLVLDDTNDRPDIFVRDRGLLSDGNDDFLADFGGAGSWERLDDTAWRKIHNASPLMIASGDLDGNLKDEAIMAFDGAGLWARYDNKTWMRLHKGTSKRFVAGDFNGNGSDDLVVDFGPAGLWVWRNNATWAKLHNGTTQDLAVGNLDGNGDSKDELIVDFGAGGLWARYNDMTWKKLHNASPVHMATGDLDGNGQDELIADFGKAGIWARFNDTTWMKLHNDPSQDLAVGDLDGNDQEDLVADLGAEGLWVLYNTDTWVKRHNASPQHMLVTNLRGPGGLPSLLADFGPAGLWVRTEDDGWVKLHKGTTQALAAGGFD
jgi:Tol biopolymer transport system component